jgi:Anti-sigma-K factor rskA, C-terminal
MSSDDDRVAELAGDDGVSLDPEELEELEELRALLADPAVWAEPDAALEDRVVSAITTEASQRPGRPVASRPRSRSRTRGWTLAVVGVAAAAILAVAVTFSLRGSGSSGEQFAMALNATELVPGAAGDATLTKTDSGWRIELDATGLPRLDGGRFYQAWLRNADGVLIPLGTFNEGQMVTLWAGVSPKDFPTLTVTQEQADGDQASSGQRVLVGQLNGP